MKAAERKQRGAAAVEFALIAVFFFAVLFGIVEFGRGLFVWNSVQEVTRYVAREAVVCWRGDWNTMRDTRGMMGLNVLPAAPEFTNASITIEPLRRADKAVLTGGSIPATVDANASNCMLPDTSTPPPNCIGYVRVRINASFTPLIGTLVWFPLPNIPLPPSTVDMPAESLGFMRAGCSA
jgi:Flp pilus assembly pilin Flp